GSAPRSARGRDGAARPGCAALPARGAPSGSAHPAPDPPHRPGQRGIRDHSGGGDMTGLSGLRYAHSAHPVLAGSPLRTAAAALLLIGGPAGSAALFITAVVAGGAEDLIFVLGEGGPVRARELAFSLRLVPLLTLPAALLTACLALRSTAG